jgi:hypothetical protein
VRAVDAEAHQAWLDALEDWHDAEGDEDRGDRPTRMRFVVSDVTMEKLAQVLQENPRGVLLHRDEFGGWIRSMNVYRGGRGADVEDFNSIWSGQPIDVLRKTTEDAYVQRPFVAVLGGLQPDRLEELATGREDGFVDRLLLVHPPPVRRRWSETAVEENVLLSYARLYKQLLALPEAEVELSAAAKKKFTTWHDSFYEWLEPRTGPVRGAAAKMPRYCARFALVLAHARESYDLVDQEDVEGAIRLVNYFTAMIGWSSDRLVPAVGNLHRDVRRLDRTARKFVEWLRAHGGTATGRQLLRAKIGGIRRAVDAKDVIDLLEQDGRVKTAVIAAPGAQESLQVTLIDDDDDARTDDDTRNGNARAHERRP